MSGISSGIGLISGIDRETLINQLIAIERRPVQTLEARVRAIDVQRAAFVALSAQLLALRNSIAGFKTNTFFNKFRTSSTQESVLTASANASARPGSFTFRVRSLVTNHAVISRGFADADRTSVGVGELSIEVGNGRVNPASPLDELNGGNGVPRGLIAITDKSGKTAQIDLTTATTVEDVLEAINSNSNINVRASVTGLPGNNATGDRIVIEDLNPGTAITGNLTVADVGDTTTAQALGIAGTVSGSRLDGSDLVKLASSTPLSLLNDGNGVGRFRTGTDLVITTGGGAINVSLSGILATQPHTDLRALNGGNGVNLGVIRITNRLDRSTDIDLSAAETVNDVVTAINNANAGVTATIVNSTLQITDKTDAADDPDDPPQLMIEDVTGSAAADLGIAATVATKSITGREIYRVETIGDVINAVNYAPGNAGLVEASISADGKGLTLNALSAGGTVIVTAGVNGDGVASTAALDLGLLDAEGVASFTTRRLVSGLNTVLLSSLNGGRGVQVGQIQLTNRAGLASPIDLSAATTLQDVIDLINADTTSGLTASVNNARNGVTLKDTSGGSGDIIVEDLTGTLATDLKLAGTYALGDGNSIDGGNLQRQYITRNTLLSTLHGGRSVGEGTFRITASSGAVYSVHVDDITRTVGGVIDAINRVTPDSIEARINDTGDGIILFDHQGGDDPLKIEDLEGGRAAVDLRLAGTAKSNENFLDGSFEIRVKIEANDRLNDIARKINNAKAGVSAAVLNHGGTFNPFSLSITSNTSGLKGELILDAIGLDLGLTTLTRPRDAVVTLGEADSGSIRVITGSSNTLEGVVPGVTLNLLSASEDPVTISVSQDTDAIVDAVADFVDRYNAALDIIDEKTSFNPDTLERGPLLGDPAVNLVRNRLVRTATRTFGGADATISRLLSVGIRFGDGNRLHFDEERFREAFDGSQEAVVEFFSREDTGLAATLDEMIDELTRTFDGVITRKDDALEQQQELVNKRIAGMNLLIDGKRARLEAQFIALESALSALQGQQNALTVLAQLASQSR